MASLSDRNKSGKLLCSLLGSLRELFLSTKLSLLLPAIPLAVAAQCFHIGRAWVFALSLLGLVPLAERLSFLTERIAYFTSSTVGGLLNATCGNAPELIIALFALHKGKIELVKWSLVGSILSNLLFVLGLSLLCGGLRNLRTYQLFDRKQADVNSGLLLLGSLCQIMPMMLRYSGDHTVSSTLVLSRASSIIMFLAYVSYLFFQIKTHRRIFEAQEVEDDNNILVPTDNEPLIGLQSAIGWLITMTLVIALLSEYLVGTIEAAAESWGLSVTFISIIVLPIVGNAPDHACSIIFAMKNKLDITLGVSLGSATQISMFVIPLCVIVAWIMGVEMDLDFQLMETGSLFLAVIVSAFMLQDGTSHYLKGVVLLLCYFVIGTCFFVLESPPNQINDTGSRVLTTKIFTA